MKGSNELTMKKIVIDTAGKSVGSIWVLVLLVAAVVFFGLIPPQILRLMIDRNLDRQSMDGLLMFALAYLIVLIIAGALDFGKGLMLTRLGQRVIRKTREEMMHKAERIPLRYFTQNAPGAITSRFTTDAETINTLFADGIISMAIDGLKIIGIIISIAFFSKGLAVITLALIPVIFLVTRIFQRRMKKAQRANLEQLGAVGNHITESIENVQMIKLFHREHYMEDAYCRKLENNYGTRRKVNFYDSAYAPIIQIIRAVIIIIVVSLSSQNLHVPGITAGMLAASIELISNLLIPIEALGMEFQNIQQGLSGIRRVDEFFSIPEEEKQDNLHAEDVIQVADGRKQASVSFEHVSFSYEKGQEVLHGISFLAEAGKSLTISGRTGVGKTTIMNLILGLLLPTEGSILINGISAGAILDSEKRKIFGYVEQKFQFVPGSVKQQITLGDTSITEEDVIKVCRFAGLHEYIEKLPQGYDTEIRNGSEFSFGQRQLLSIARAVAADPPVLLLDEITANLDSATEERIMDVLSKACEERTIINISHRMGARLFRDKIVHMEQGRVVDIS